MSRSSESHPHRLPAGQEEARELELEVVQEIADAFLTSTSPLEVYRTALAGVTPLVGAEFASVFLRDPDDPELLSLACAQNWPQRSARFLGDLRIREGRGPTGQAVEKGHSIEVEDVFADDTLREWWEPARELGFVSMTSHPLSVDERVFGALSFYFRERQDFTNPARALLRIVAHQLAATAERAHLVADLQSSASRLEREDRTLTRKIASIESVLERLKDRAGEDVRADRSGPGEGSA